MNKGTSYYDILNVNPKASDDDIRRAYRALAKKHHPDLNPQNRRLAEIKLRLLNEAYTKLKTRESRADYNRTMRIKAENDNAQHAPSLFSQIAEIFWPAHTKQRTK